MPISAQEYRLGPDDELQITVFREEDLDRTVQVSPDGNISYPLLGNVQAGGLTITELEKNMAEGFKKYLKNPQVNVLIKEYPKFTVTGQVEKPGSYPLKGETTVLEAIGIAGGFSKYASQNSVKVLRMENGKKKTISVKVGKISKTGDRSKDISLKRGDIIYVPESMF
jgi:polysaccharide export outer membrane protein